MAGKLGRPKKKTRQKQPTKVCTNCNRELSAPRNFYVCSNPMASNDGKYVNICKDCMRAVSYTLDGKLNIEAFKKMLMLIDRPFIPEVIQIAIDEGNRKKAEFDKRTDKRGNKEGFDIIGLYMKNISSLPQYSKLSFLDSINAEQVKPTVQNSNVIFSNTPQTQTPVVQEPVVKQEVINKPIERVEQIDSDVIVHSNVEDEFIVTDEMIDRFGEGYTTNQYRKMQRKYDKLKQNYQLTTNLHEEALATYVRFKVKEEEATARGDVTSADKWNRAAQDAADKAKLTPKQLTQADLQGGITTISELSKAVEEAVDVIEILPRFKYAPNDAPDFIIWCYVNFIRKLKGLPTVEYSEVYAFYDRMKEEYLSQYGDPYGIFTHDTAEKNREVVQKFIKLPEDYNYGSDDDGE